MKNAWLCLYLSMAAVIAFSQPKKGAAASAGIFDGAKICRQPYQVQGQAEGWPEGPVRILFHREDSKSPWSPNPAIHIPGLEAVAASNAKTLVCVKESQVEMGHYDSGELAYSPSWQVILVRLADRKPYFYSGTMLNGEMPPDIKWKKGAGIGKPPTAKFVLWLRLLADQKVARLKLRLRPRESYEVCAMAFSGDGTKLVVAQRPRSSSSGTTPAPISVFDLATGNLVASMKEDFSTRGIALSKSGTTIATENDGHVEIWDAASGKVVMKPETSGVTSLLFGPDDTLGAAGGDKAQVWDIRGNRILHSGAGSQVQLSPDGAWISIINTPTALKVQAFESGSELAVFPSVNEHEQNVASRDGRAMAYSSSLSAAMYVAGNKQGRSLELPNLGVNLLSAMAATRDGFVVGNGDGILGVVSGTVPEPRAFATDITGITTIAVSPDGRVIAAGNRFGLVEVWELR